MNATAELKAIQAKDQGLRVELEEAIAEMQALGAEEPSAPGSLTSANWLMRIKVASARVGELDRAREALRTQGMEMAHLAAAQQAAAAAQQSNRIQLMVALLTFVLGLLAGRYGWGSK